MTGILNWKTESGKTNWYLVLGTGITGFVLSLIFIGLLHPPYDIEAMDTAHKFAGGSLRHLFGTDNFGRDVFSRVLAGGFTTMKIAAGTVAVGLLGGVLIGAVTGYFGGLTDELLMRINDTLFAFPSVLLALVIVSLFGSGTSHVIWALGIAFVPSFARMVRSEFLRYKNSDFIAGAKLQGAGALRIMTHHILPNAAPVLMSSVMIGFNNAVLAEAGLSYLGIGVQPPEPSLGSMLSEAQSYLVSAPLYAAGPGLMIIFMVLGFSLLAEGMSREQLSGAWF
nr:ABC transporter permease [Lachnoclostridium sp. Marseille-P6806]